MLEKREVTQREFNEQVEQYIKDSNCRNMEDFCSKYLQATRVINQESVQYNFFSNPLSQNYLNRKSITFADRHPQLVRASSGSLLDSDDYELTLYSHRPDLIVFRNENICTDKFYTEGNKADLENQAVFNLLFKRNSQLFEIAPVLDIFKIARDATTRALPGKEKKSAHFLIYPNWYNAHATTCLSILNPRTKQVLVTVFINSFQEESWSKHIRTLFRMDQNQRLSEEDPTLQEYFKTQFNININRKEDITQLNNEIRISESEKAVLLINVDHNYKKEHSLEYNFCDTIYTLSDKGPLGFSIYRTHSPKSPFIDASHNIQYAKDDNNCSLYSYNFIKALMNYLGDTKRAETVLSLAHRISQTNIAIQKNKNALFLENDISNLQILIGQSLSFKQEFEQSIQELKTLFGEGLKSFLTCYYNEDNSAKSPEEITAFHLKQRWEIGGEWLAVRFPSQANGHQMCQDEEKGIPANSIKYSPEFSLFPSALESLPPTHASSQQQYS